MSLRKDLAGQRFGRLLVLSYGFTLKGDACWRCRCECGTGKIIRGSVLQRGTTKSCGCLKREGIIARSTTHGMAGRQTRTPTYSTWRRMISYTTDPAHPRYPGWGGRGISVCARWHDYPAFLADMGEKPPGMTLDRIDNDGNYEPDNCRWATSAQQARNTRRTRLTPPKVRDIQRLHAQGLAVGAIADAVSVERHTVGTVCIVLDALNSDC